MNFDDYAKYMTHKLRLTTAIAIIKTKPHNLTTTEYINEIRNKIITMDDDLDITLGSDDFRIDDDDELSKAIKECDTENTNDDILHRDDILKEYGSVNSRESIRECNIVQNIETVDDNLNLRDTILKEYTSIYANDNILKEYSIVNNTERLDNDMNLSDTILKEYNPFNGNVNILKDYGTVNDNTEATLKGHSKENEHEAISKEHTIVNNTKTLFKKCNVENSNSQNILKEYNIQNNNGSKEPMVTLPNNFSQTTFCESQTQNQSQIYESLIPTDITYYENTDVEESIPNSVLIKDKNAVKSNDTYDTQKTILYTVHGFTQDCTHYSPSQSDIRIPDKYIYGPYNNTGSTDNNKNTRYNQVGITNKIIINNKTNSVSDIINTERKVTDKVINKTQSTDIHNKTVNSSSNNNYGAVTNVENATSAYNNIKHQNKNVKNSNSNKKSTIESSGNLQHGDTILNTGHNSLTNIDKNQNLDEMSQNIDYLNIFSQNFDEYYTDSQHLNTIKLSNSNYNKLKDTNLHEKEYNIQKDQQMDVELNEYAQNIISNDNFTRNNEQTRLISDDMTNTVEINDIFASNNEDINDKNVELNDNYKSTNTEPNIITKDSTNADENNDIFSQNIVEINDIQIMDLAEDCNEEVIPFKVLEELNKVKIYLRKNERRISTDGFSSDSGYRSDSQGKSSYRGALQLSGVWLNQSGHCLFSYLTTCPLLVMNRDITNEIAEVLSQLIDRLHEEEKYPSFLEELLDFINILLRQLHEGENCDENVLLKRDDTIQRLIILNKSIHIQKYSIAKIIEILHYYHTNVSNNESILELTNIDKIENSYYIFHILEILLKKYMKNKQNESQLTTQTSQEEYTFKKSAITDLWKRKWDPNYKDGGKEDNREKKCVLSQCSEILNKIIVDSLNSYSLVSYIALKCFNLLQS